MSSRKNYSTIFDDDFEVTYEEEPSVFTDDYHTDASRQRQFEEVEYDEYDNMTTLLSSAGKGETIA